MLSQSTRGSLLPSMTTCLAKRPTPPQKSQSQINALGWYSVHDVKGEKFPGAK